MKLFAVESNSQRLDGGSMFGNAPKAMWSKWVNVDEQNSIPLATRALLVKTDDNRHILFETGIGGFFEPKLKERYGVVEEEHMLLKNLHELNIDEADIDAVVLSHLHFDHAGGILPSYGETPRLLFPNAKIYLGKQHWLQAKHPHMRERASYIPLLYDLLAKSDRLVLIDEPHHSDLDFVTFHFSNGHTIGLMMSEIAHDDGPILFITDLVPGMAWVHLPITMGYDRFSEEKIDEKKKTYEYLLKKNGRVFFTHDPETACGILKQDEKGKFFVEVSPLP